MFKNFLTDKDKNYMAKQKSPRIVTPKGIAVYPWLNKPDTKFSPEGDYKVTLKVPAEDAAPLIEQLDKILQEYKAEAVKKDPKIARMAINAPYEEEADDQGNLTGNYLFKFKQKAVINMKDGRTVDVKVALLDASRTPTDVLVGGGSEIKIAATVYPYAMNTTKTIGLSLRPYAVQILQLVKVGGGAAADVFEDEDGFIDDHSATQVASASVAEEANAADF
jgi:hypothetical protein